MMRGTLAAPTARGYRFGPTTALGAPPAVWDLENEVDPPPGTRVFRSERTLLVWPAWAASATVPAAADGGDQSGREEPRQPARPGRTASVRRDCRPRTLLAGQVPRLPRGRGAGLLVVCAHKVLPGPRPLLQTGLTQHGRSGPLPTLVWDFPVSAASL